MLLRPFVLTAVLSLTLATSGSAQQAAEAAEPRLVEPGAGQVDGTILVPYTNAWDWVQVGPDGAETDLGVWTDEVTLEEDEGGTIMRRVQVFNTPRGETVWVNRVRHASLEPVSFEAYLSGEPKQELLKIEFDGQKIVGFDNRSGETQDLATSLGRAVFDWNLYGVLLAGFPLEVGFQAKFPIFNPAQGVDWRSVTVTEKGPAPGPMGGDFETYKVEVDDGLTFWVAKKPPYVIHGRNEMPNGAIWLWNKK